MRSGSSGYASLWTSERARNTYAYRVIFAFRPMGGGGIPRFFVSLDPRQGENPLFASSVDTLDQ